MLLSRPMIIPALFVLFTLPIPAQAEGQANAADMPAAISGAAAVPSMSEPDPMLADEANDIAQEPEEIKPTGPLSPTDKIVRRFMELDLDASEGVSFEEYMTMVNKRAEDRFKSMDSNQDEEVSEEEYRNFWLARKAQWYRLKR